MSKMNKSELYTLAKQQKEELMTASLFNNSLEEEIEELKKKYEWKDTAYDRCFSDLYDAHKENEELKEKLNHCHIISLKIKKLQDD